MNKNNDSSEERRQHPRVDKNYILTFSSVDRPTEKHEITQLKNISRGGLRFVTTQAIALNSKLNIDLKTPFIADTKNLTGIVLECHEQVKDMLYEIRLRFEDLPPETEFVLDQVMDYILHTDEEDNHA